MAGSRSAQQLVFSFIKAASEKALLWGLFTDRMSCLTPICKNFFLEEETFHLNSCSIAQRLHLGGLHCNLFRRLDSKDYRLY